MALTPELIKENESLSELSEDQIAAITTLSVNDEDKVIGQKVGELHGRYDEDIKTVAGIEKNAGEKSYEYMKRALSTFKTQAESTSTLQASLDEAHQKVTDLEKAAAEGSTDPVLKQQLKDAQDNLTALESTFETEKGNWEKEKSKFAEQVTSIQVDTAFDRAAAGLKFKTSYPASVQKTLTRAAKAEVLADVTPDWIESGGEKVMVLRDKQGEILRNKNNKLNPYTVEELLSEKLKDVLDAGVQRKGGETKNDGSAADNVTLVEVSAAKTQVEADEIISKYLLQNGMTRGSTEFSEEQAKIRKENNVEKLPLR